MSTTEPPPPPGAPDEHASAGTRRRAHRKGGRGPRHDVRAALAAAAALLAVLSGAAPTGVTILDWLLTAGAAAIVTLAGANARRWVFPVLTGPALVIAQWGDVAVIVGAWAIFALAMVTALRRRRSPLLGMLTAGAGVQLLLWLPSFWFVGAPTLLAVACVASVLISARRASRRRTRRRTGQAALLLVGAVLVLVGLASAATLLAQPSARDAVDAARAGLSAARSGNSDHATAELRRATAEFESANSTLRWAGPARAVPVLSQQLGALDVLTARGAALTQHAAEATETADVRSIAVTQGAVNLAALEDMEAPVVAARDDLRAALDDLDALRSPWLVGPLADELEGFTDEVVDATADAELVATGVRLAPALLGGDEPRRYFVAAINTAEARAGGGIIGNYVELTATDGNLEKTASGRAGADLNRAGDPDNRVLEAPDDYLARYGERGVERFWQDLPLSPDFPSVAEAVASLYPQSGGAPVDGVIAMDTFALAAFLELTGPVAVDDLDEPLTAENAVEFLLHEQYVRFPERSERVDFLEDLTNAIFDEITDGTLPQASRLGEVLGPMVEQGRLRFHSFHPEEQAFIEELGLDGAFPEPDGDSLALVTQNDSHSKIDWFLHRELSYEVDLDPATGQVEAVAVATLRNEAPASGLPTYIIGGNQAAPGVNRAHVSLYSGLALTGATLDGEPELLTPERELGHNVYSGYVEIPPGGSVELRYELTGRVELHTRGGEGGGLMYTLDVFRQPTVHPDELAVNIDVPDAWAADPVRDRDRSGTQGALKGSSEHAENHQQEQNKRIEVLLRPR